jgi:hypothetical protein
MSVPCCIQSTSYCTACSKEFVLVIDSDSVEIEFEFRIFFGRSERCNVATQCDSKVY